MLVGQGAPSLTALTFAAAVSEAPDDDFPDGQREATMAGYELIIRQLAASPRTRIGAPTRLETGIVLTARFGPRGKTALARFLQENSIQTVAFDDAHASVALDAYSQFGKGRHPAALNFGDCCTYALASVAGEPLLCVGDDFARTDLRLVSLNPDEPSAASEKSGEPGR